MCTFRIRSEGMLIAVHREVGNPLALDHSRSELVIDRDGSACRVHELVQPSEDDPEMSEGREIRASTPV